MNNTFEKQRERANSYFQLAQLLAVIAGFLMLANSVYIQRALTDGGWLMTKYDLKTINWSSEIASNGQAYQLVMMTGTNKMKADAFFIASIIFGIAAFGAWVKGKKLIDAL